MSDQSHGDWDEKQSQSTITDPFSGLSHDLENTFDEEMRPPSTREVNPALKQLDEIQQQLSHQQDPLGSYPRPLLKSASEDGTGSKGTGGIPSSIQRSTRHRRHSIGSLHRRRRRKNNRDPEGGAGDGAQSAHHSARSSLDPVAELRRGHHGSIALLQQQQQREQEQQRRSRVESAGHGEEGLHYDNMFARIRSQSPGARIRKRRQTTSKAGPLQLCAVEIQKQTKVNPPLNPPNLPPPPVLLFPATHPPTPLLYQHTWLSIKSAQQDGSDYLKLQKPHKKSV
jgi:hypothetical protein